MRTEERRTTNERKQTGGTKAEASEKKKIEEAEERGLTSGTGV